MIALYSVVLWLQLAAAAQPLGCDHLVAVARRGRLLQHLPPLHWHSVAQSSADDYVDDDYFVDVRDASVVVVLCFQ